MATVIDMPKLSDTMEEGVIAKWNIKEGDTVSPGDIVAEIETDKATMDLEAFDGGTVLKILAKEGDSVPLGGKLVILGEEGEDISDLESGGSGGDSGKKEADSKEETKEEDAGEKDSKEKESKDDESGDEAGKEESGAKDEKSGDKAEKAESGGKDDESDEKAEKAESGAAKKADRSNGSDTGGRVKASPLARRMAEDRGIDISKVKGSGPQGRIVKADVESHKEEAPDAAEDAPKTSFREGVSREGEDVKVSQMRKTIGKRLAESKYTFPHFYETIDIDMKKAVEVRTSLNEISDVKISFNDLVVKACAVALRQHPWINASWKGDVIRLHGDVHVAVAVAIDEGLLTPVIRHTDQKGLRDISLETKELAGKARDKKLQPEDWEGSTFTISNLGMFGIEEFTAIINPPNASILAIGAIRDVPVVEDGQVVPGKRMKVTLSSDHRVVDGAKAAEFLSTVRNLLENPASMLL